MPCRGVALRGIAAAIGEALENDGSGCCEIDGSGFCCIGASFAGVLGTAGTGEACRSLGECRSIAGANDGVSTGAAMIGKGSDGVAAVLSLAKSRATGIDSELFCSIVGGLICGGNGGNCVFVGELGGECAAFKGDETLFSGLGGKGTLAAVPGVIGAFVIDGTGLRVGLRLGGVARPGGGRDARIVLPDGTRRC